MRIGFFSLLTVLLICLKLTGTITLSWFWVLFIITIPATILFLIILIWMVLHMIEEFK